MSAHTPGPWGHYVEIANKDGWGQSKQVVSVWGGEVLIANYDTSFMEYPNDRTNEANARLIAAAPELLEAVIRLAEALEDGHWQNTKERLRELIAKATGAA